MKPLPEDLIDAQKHLEIDDDEIRRISEATVQSDLILSDCIYTELRLFKDFSLGTLHSFMPSVEHKDRRDILYQGILDGLPAYEKRDFDDIAHYFPAFGLTNDVIYGRMGDKEFSSYILHHAPITPFVETMKSQIAVNVNHSAVVSKKDPIELIVNTYPLELTPLDRHIVGLFFSDLLKVTVKVLYLDVATLSLSFVQNCDEIYTYHFKEFFSQKAVRDSYASLKFINKRLFVPRLFGRDIIKGMNLDQQELTVKTRCDVLTTFKFLPTALFSGITKTKKES